MAAQLTHECFPQPSNAALPVWRYMDLASLVLFLDRQSLCFRRVELFKDAYEGRWPPKTIARWREQMLASAPNQIAHIDAITDRWDGFGRSGCYANCWCLQEHESEALWQVYGGPNAVAIRSTYTRLAECLPEPAFLGMVTYVNHASAEIETGNALAPVMCKRREFSHENECRALLVLPEECFLDPPKSAFRRFTPKRPDSVWRPIDVERLIDAVVTSPYAAPWVEESTKALVQRFCSKLRVERSTMLLPGT